MSDKLYRVILGYALILATIIANGDRIVGIYMAPTYSPLRMILTIGGIIVPTVLVVVSIYRDRVMDNSRKFNARQDAYHDIIRRTVTDDLLLP